MELIQRFSYLNRGKINFTLTIEPWAQEYIIEPGQKVDVVVRSKEASGVIEIEQFSDSIVIYGYVGCIIDVMQDGKEI